MTFVVVGLFGASLAMLAWTVNTSCGRVLRYLEARDAKRCPRCGGGS